MSSAGYPVTGEAPGTDWHLAVQAFWLSKHVDITSNEHALMKTCWSSGWRQHFAFMCCRQKCCVAALCRALGRRAAWPSLIRRISRTAWHASRGMRCYESSRANDLEEHLMTIRMSNNNENAVCADYVRNTEVLQMVGRRREGRLLSTSLQ